MISRILCAFVLVSFRFFFLYAMDDLLKERLFAAIPDYSFAKHSLFMRSLRNKAWINTPDSNQQTLLHHATAHQNLDAVRMLITYGADPTYRGQLDSTLLDYADAHHEILYLLLSNGAQLSNDGPTHIMQIQEWIWNAIAPPEYEHLWNAVIQGDYDVVEHALVQDETKNFPFMRNTYRDTPLHLATRRGNYKLARLLLKHNAPVNARDSTSSTPLYWACCCGHKKIAHELLKANAHENISSKELLWCLCAAAFFDRAEILLLLIRYGIKVNRLIGRAVSPVAGALAAHAHRALKILLAYGACVFYSDGTSVLASIKKYYEPHQQDMSTVLNIIMPYMPQIQSFKKELQSLCDPTKLYPREVLTIQQNARLLPLAASTLHINKIVGCIKTLEKKDRFFWMKLLSSARLLEAIIKQPTVGPLHRKFYEIFKSAFYDTVLWLIVSGNKNVDFVLGKSYSEYKTIIALLQKLLKQPLISEHERLIYTLILKLPLAHALYKPLEDLGYFSRLPVEILEYIMFFVIDTHIPYPTQKIRLAVLKLIPTARLH